MVKLIKGDSKQKFLKSLAFFTQTSARNRKIALIFYSVNAKGEPGELLNTETIVCNLKKGTKETRVDLVDYAIELPKEGVYVGLQHLLIEDNKMYSHDKNATPLSYFYEPGLYFSEDSDSKDSWCFYDEKWKLYPSRSLNLGVELTD